MLHKYSYILNILHKNKYILIVRKFMLNKLRYNIKEIKISLYCFIFLTVLIECLVIPAIRLTDKSLLSSRSVTFGYFSIKAAGEVCAPVTRPLYTPYYLSKLNTFTLPDFSLIVFHFVTD